MRKIILASNSPRRKRILRQIIGNDFRIVASSYEEDNSLGLAPLELVLHHSLQKARAAAKKLESGIVISADTIVVLDNKIIGKPHSRENAMETLKKISGKEIDVLSGLAVIDIDNKKEYQDHETTKVKIRNLTTKEIVGYVNTGEPLDKAGAFGIQEKGAAIVERIEGCYFNVSGLPVYRLVKIFEKLGISVFDYK
jgi:septum formation protein